MDQAAKTEAMVEGYNLALTDAVLVLNTLLKTIGKEVDHGGSDERYWGVKMARDLVRDLKR